MSDELQVSETAMRPQLGPIKLLHRHDGYITFARGSGDDWKQVISIRADALDSIFPEFTAELTRDSFVSINAAYRLAYGSTGHTHGFPMHRNDTLKYLCACYVDLDYYKMALKSHQVIGEVARMLDEGEIPQVSMAVDSGHGMWLLWVLHDEARSDWAHLGAYGDSPNDHLQLYVKINRELAKRLNHLGADSISDGARSIRVPGSFRNDTERYVKWGIYGRCREAIQLHAERSSRFRWHDPTGTATGRTPRSR